VNNLLYISLEYHMVFEVVSVACRDKTAAR